MNRYVNKFIYIYIQCTYLKSYSYFYIPLHSHMRFCMEKLCLPKMLWWRARPEVCTERNDSKAKRAMAECGCTIFFGF